MVPSRCVEDRTRMAGKWRSGYLGMYSLESRLLEGRAKKGGERGGEVGQELGGGQQDGQHVTSVLGRGGGRRPCGDKMARRRKRSRTKGDQHQEDWRDQY